MVAVLALDPWALLHPGFWLSFVAVAILFSGGPRRQEVHGHGTDAGRGPRRIALAALALLGTLMLYQRPDFLVNLADQLWSCF